MSQKGDDFDFSYKNFYSSLMPTPGGMPQQQPPAQFMPPPNGQMSMPNYWDWWNNYYAAASAVTNPSPFDVGYREEIGKNQMFNPGFQPPSSSAAQTPAQSSGAKASTASSQSSQTNKTNLGSASAVASSAKQSNMSAQQQYSSAANASFMRTQMPFMDPATYMYYAQMSQPFGFPMHPFQNPFGMPPPSGMPPFLSYGSASLAGGQRQLQDDQNSLHSFHFDLDTRSEKKLNITNTNRAQSVKNEPIDSKMSNKLKNYTGGATGLLIEDPQAQAQQTNLEINGLDQTNSILETANMKRDEHRMTPQLHQLPHVRATFSLNGIVQIRANDPCEGQPALVDILNLSDLMENYLTSLKNLKKNEKFSNLNDFNDEESTDGSVSSEMRNEILINYKLLQEFPGPLIKEHTSKAQLIQFCQKNVKECLSSTNVNLIDPQSHALLWDYLSLLVRQNGIVDLKTDISPLLLSGIADNISVSTTTTSTTTTTTTIATTSKLNQPIHDSPSSSSLSGLALQQQQDFVFVNNDGASSNNIESNELVSANDAKNKSQKQQQQKQLLSEEDLHLNKLRQLLGAGQKSDAIDLAIKYNMWPHALFLASASNLNTQGTIATTTSITTTTISTAFQPAQQSGHQINVQNESKILNKVKARFINSLQAHDPIHTCYQLLIGRIPTVASNLSKTEWNDWRRHLAMIVSNVDDTNRDLVLNSIKTMGDSLASNGRVAASHFCYLLSDCTFGTYNKKSSKLVLIGSSHNQEFNKFCQINAIQATEIFEFAHSLSSSKSPSSSLLSNGVLDHFVKYKLIYTTRLLEFGLINEACKYIEVIAKSINQNSRLHSDKISSVFQLANRLRVYDSDFNIEDLENAENEPQWFQELTNNYKQMHLKKLWNLFPSKTTDTTLSQSKSTGVENTLTSDLDVQTKNEPKTAEPSPVNNQKQMFVPTANYQMDLNNQMNRLTIENNNNNYGSENLLQQQTSLPFYPQFQQDHTNDVNQNNNQSQDEQINFQQQQQEQAAQISARRYAIDSQQQQQNVYEQAHNQSQYYSSPDLHLQQQQQQQQLQQQPQQQQYHQNQMNLQFASTSNLPQTAANVANNQSQQQYNQNFYNPLSSQQRKLSTSSASGLSNSNQNDLQTKYNMNRSRQSSTSNQSESNQSSLPPFNPYQSNQKQQHQQQHQQQSQQIFDPTMPPKSSNLTKSPTYPLSQSENQQSLSHLNNPIKEESNEEKSSDENLNDNSQQQNKNEDADDYDDDEEFSAANKKNKKNNPQKKDISQPEGNQSDWWFKRMIKSIRPATGPKQMVLPDDRKKTIIWDDKLKRYVNKDASQDTAASIKPPPIFLPTSNQTESSMPAQHQNTASANVNQESKPNDSQQAEAIATAQPNRFSLKNSTAKRATNYYSKLDIMADQTKKLNASNEPSIMPLLSTMPPPSQLPPRFFVPMPPTTNLSEQQSEQTDEDRQDAYQTENAQMNQQYQEENQYQQQQMYQQQQQQQQQQHQQNQQTYQQQNSNMYLPNQQNSSGSYYNPEQNQQQQMLLQNYQQPQNNENNSTEDSDSATNSAESYNGSYQTTSSSNDSAYSQNQYNQQLYGSYAPQSQQAYGNYENNQYYQSDQYYNPNSNI